MMVKMEMLGSPIVGFLLLLGVAFFFGLAFEEFHAQDGQARPGGVRSFPLLALSGALLYRLDTQHLLPLSAGLLVLGFGWLATTGSTSRRSIRKAARTSG
jgi:hypothetical protein